MVVVVEVVVMMMMGFTFLRVLGESEAQSLGLDV